MCSFVKKLVPFLPNRLIICDVGARLGIGEPWNHFRDLIRLISFEPEKDEFELLKLNKDINDMVFQYALYKEKENVSFNVTKLIGASSLYKPNYNFLNNYPNPERFKIEDVVDVEATSLDTLYRDKIFVDMDFIKVDAQGAELDILKGGENVLSKNIIGVEVEVEFQLMYENQPLFSDVDHFIRNKLGLQIQDIRKTYWKHPEGINIGSKKGQLIFGDALYFRAPYEMLSWCSGFDRNKASNKIMMACLMGIVYGYLDYSLCLLNQHSIYDFLEKEMVDNWKSLILRYGKSFEYNRKGVGKLSSIFNILYRMCQPTHDGWASLGHHLGARKKYGIFT